MDSETCGCGQPLHYTDPMAEAMVRELVAKQGVTVDVTVPGKGTYAVPRHFIALHGLKAEELDRLGFEVVP